MSWWTCKKINVYVHILPGKEIDKITRENITRPLMPEDCQ